jgi:hypothetical protein
VIEWAADVLASGVVVCRGPLDLDVQVWEVCRLFNRENAVTGLPGQRDWPGWNRRMLGCGMTGT